MDIYSKLELIKRGGILEILSQEELINLLETNSKPKHYIGFEISGKVHIGTGLLTALKIKDFMAAGIKTSIFLADYHAWINNKFDGDLDKIQKVAGGYFKAAFLSLGLENVDFIFGSKLYEEFSNQYWKNVLLISKDTTLNRMLRCTTIMGRTQKENLASSAIIYPAMQVSDMWALDIDIAHAGMDQRKVHVLARELAPKYKYKKIIAIHTKLVPGLGGKKKMLYSDEDEEMLETKMSKSKPESCIFIHDSEEEIAKKINKAACPPAEIDNNPILDYIELFVLRDREFKIERDLKYGGDISYSSIQELKKDYSEGKIHPLDLKKALTKELVRMLAPSREFFNKNKNLLRDL
ncbi:MAG: tyrosine--tRNA ligase [Candidatus Micrarchaeota archaeon]|nr:tyrosine--tRNA ligase [Candidatus Micrarchaeota archaeon]